MKELSKKIAALLLCATISISSSGCTISDYDNNHSEPTATANVLNNIETQEGNQQEIALVGKLSEH